MAIAYTDIAAYMTAAVTALAAADYAAARDNALAAQALASVLPDTARSSGDGGQQSLTWDRVAISQFVDRVQRIANSAAGIQVSKVQIDRPTECGVSQIGIW